MIEGLLGVVLELFAELVLSVALEILVELGLFAARDAGARVPGPWASAAGHTLLGATLGGLSLLVLPHRLLHDPVLAGANLVITPVLAGTAMAGVGALRRRRGQPLVRLDSFAFGALFALAFAGVRWAFAGPV